LVWQALSFFGGIAIVLGLFTRLFALIATAEMAVAYFMFHASQGPFPILNQGELAVLYFTSFLLMAVYGAGRWSLEKAFFGKEIF
jgi:putative oxidoreductase